MSLLSSVLVPVLASARHQILVFLHAWQVPVILGVIQPAVLLEVTLSMPAHVSPVYASWASLGALLVSFWSSTLWTGGGILRQERAEGTLAPCMIGVRDARLVLLGKSLGTSAISAMITVMTVVAVLAARRQPVRFDHLWWLVAGLVVLFLSGLILGVGLASLFILTRFGTQISAALMYPVFLLSGLLTPLSAVPAEIRWLSWAISLRWIMAFLSSTIHGSPDLPALGMVIALSAGYAAAAAYAFRQFVALTLEKGSIDFV